MPFDKKTVLVVDDEEKNLELARVILKKEGYALLYARSGSEALDMLDERTVDILVLDLMMPDIDGFDMLRRLNASGKNASLQTIIVSALNDAETREAVHALGAERYLAKPYDIMTLKALLKEMAVSAELSAEEAERHVLQAYEALFKELDEETKQQIVQTYLHAGDMQIPVQTQLEYLSWFFGESDAAFAAGTAVIEKGSCLLVGDPVLDRLQDRMNRIVVRKKTQECAVDPDMLFERCERFFLRES